MITILGPTATGKTRLAAFVASKLGGEIISADSRQVYKNMDIGTGKDLEDYVVNGNPIPYHLVDIVNPGDEYNVYQFSMDFQKVHAEIIGRGRLPILCGGTGLYIQSVLNGYQFVTVPENQVLRSKLDQLSEEELTTILLNFGPTHATTDIENRYRLMRAIEIRTFYQESGLSTHSEPVAESLIFGIQMNRKDVRERITHRLQQRLDHGMIEEVQSLIESGVKPERLLAYGLEYKFITRYLLHEISYSEMFQLLNTAIHQFAKRQMTWFRRMEKQHFHIIWLDGLLSLEEKFNEIEKTLNKT